MVRGVKVDDGATRVAQNGYHYTKENGKWRLTHHILAEKALGRPLQSWERVKFKDNNRKHLDPKNLLVVDREGVTPEMKVAKLDAQIAELTSLRDAIVAEMIASR
jgi:hypothetical protein